MSFPVIDPAVDADTAPFWEALERGEIVTAWCDQCDAAIWPPRSHCPTCWTRSTHTASLPTTGEIYSYSVVHRGDGPWKEAGPYVIAYVTLDGAGEGVGGKGPTIIANVDPGEGGPSTLSVGQRVGLRSPGVAGGGAVFLPA